MACTCATCCSPDSQDKRLRSSLHLIHEDRSLLIDAGPDLRQQLLRAEIDQVDSILFTHEHRDHTGGLSEADSLVFKQKKPIALYAGARVLERLQQEYAYLFSQSLHPSIPSFELFTIDYRPFGVDNCSVVPIRVIHDKLPIWGFRLGALTYITDAKAIAEEEIAKVRGTRILIVNALQKETDPKHFSLAEAIAFAQQVNAKETYITHISHCMGRHQEVSQELPPHIHLAYDGLRLSL